MMTPSIPPIRIKKINKVLELIPSFKRVVVGVSGGADSIALAHFLHARGYRVIVAHLHHGRRGKLADRDQQFVKQWAMERKLPFYTQKINLGKGGNFEARARLARYGFLEEIRKKVRARHIAVAHHSDDQAETILLNLWRGCDLPGARGMLTQNQRVIRPFLSLSKREILNYVETHHLAFCEDETNALLNYRRNTLRHLVIPELEKNWPSVKTDLLQLGLQAEQQYAVMRQHARAWLTRHMRAGTFKRSAFANSNDELQRAVLRILVGAKDTYRHHLLNLQQFLLTAKTGRLHQIRGWEFAVVYDRIEVTPVKKHYISGRMSGGRGSAPSAKTMDILKSGHTLRWHGWRLKLDKQAPLPSLTVRTWSPGDRFTPAGMIGTKKVQDFFVDRKIPRAQRHTIPIVLENNEILAIGALRLSARGREKKIERYLKIF